VGLRFYRVVAEIATGSQGFGKGIGGHTFRHSCATMVKANGGDVETVQESLRHASSKVTLGVYTQAVTPVSVKRKGRKVVEMIRRIVASRDQRVPLRSHADGC